MEQHITGHNKRARELQAKGMSASQAGRRAFREAADRRSKAERDHLDGKGGKR